MFLMLTSELLKIFEKSKNIIYYINYNDEKN